QVAVVRRLDVGDVQEAVAADAEVHERRLDARLDVDDAALVDVADVALVAGALDVQLLQDAVLQDGDAALLRLQHVDEHFLLHGVPFWGSAAGAAPAKDSSCSSTRVRSTTVPASTGSGRPSRPSTSSGRAVPLGVTSRSIPRAPPSAESTRRSER